MYNQIMYMHMYHNYYYYYNLLLFVSHILPSNKNYAYCTCMLLATRSRGVGDRRSGWQINDEMGSWANNCKL